MGSPSATTYSPVSLLRRLRRLRSLSFSVNGVAFGDNLQSSEPPAPPSAATESLVLRKCAANIGVQLGRRQHGIYGKLHSSSGDNAGTTIRMQRWSSR